MPKAKDICNSNQCNLPCERLYLQHNITVADDGTARLTFIATNISGRRITSPIMLVSSLLGYFVFANGGMEAGETKKVTRTYKIQSDEYQQRKLSNVSFLARAVPVENINLRARVVPTQDTTVYTPGARLSPIVKQEAVVTDRGLIDIAAGIHNTYINYSIMPFSTLDSFSTDLSPIIQPGTSVQIDPSRDPGYFTISGTSLILKPGVKLPLSTSVPVNVSVLITYNNKCPIGSACALNYSATSGEVYESETFYATYVG